MDLKDKVINLLGDSITEGAGASSIEFCYASLLEKAGIFAEVRNYGIGGTRIAPNHNPSLYEIWDQDFCKRARTMEPADYIVVFGGTNDFGHGDAPFGDLSDTTSDSFCGSCHVLLDTLKSNFPEAKLLVITPLHRDEEDAPMGEGAQKSGKILRNYVDAILAIAKEQGVPVLNLYDDEPFPANAEYLMDGLHPNDKGHAVLAKTILAYLEKME